MTPLREVATTRVLEESPLGGWGQRRRRDASVLAALALVAVLWMRSNGQAVGVVIGEAVVVLALFAAGALLCRFNRCVGQFRIGSASPEPLADVARVPATAIARSVRGESLGRLVGATSLLVPILSRVAIQAAGGTATACEMVLLTTLGIAAITLVYCSAHPRHAALSVVCSGFLLLFTTAISDRVETFYLSVLWVLICLWWMLANHWERLEVHLAQSVHRRRGVRFGMTALGLFVCGLAVLASWGRGPAARMLDGGVMPTSGGNRWADPSARSGVGDGDAVVAAKKHAVSFGAVESEMFLQSHQPSLYDLFDDVIGKPRPTLRSDKAVSLPSQTQRSRQRKAVQSQQASTAFSIARESVQKRPQLAEKKTAALLQWVGPAGVRLAMQRYDHFDGIRWTEADPPGEARTTAVLGAVSGRLLREELGERIWYFRAAAKSTAGKSPLLGPSRADAVKIINLRSARIPAPATTAAVHIADVGRDDFFDISPDGSFYMPGRLQVPSLTVIRLVTHEVDADHLQMATLPRGAARLPERMETSEGAEIAARLAREWTAGASTDWERAERIIQRLREDFVFDRLVETAEAAPLADFLTRRRGGDHLFATAATVMLRSLGFQARLTTGFYAPPSGYDRVAGQIEILPDDAHVWVEILADADLWLALEPTPGYAPPRLYRSFWRRAADASWAAAFWAGLGLFGGTLAWWSRRIWGEWCCAALWWLSRPLAGRRRLALLVRMLDLRGRLAGLARPAGVTPRRWIEQATPPADASLRATVGRLFDVADAAFYGPQNQIDSSRAWLDDADRVASGMTVQKLGSVRKGV